MVVGEFLRLHNDYDYYNAWPPNSPDRSHIDYYVCGAVKKDVNRRASTTKAQLINRIKAVLETPWKILLK